MATPGQPPLDGQPEVYSQMPFMDHWNVSHPHISLRDIIKEEQALQDSMEKVRRALIAVNIVKYLIPKQISINT